MWEEEAEGVDCGEEAAQWICKFLNKTNLRYDILAKFSKQLGPCMRSKPPEISF